MKSERVLEFGQKALGQLSVEAAFAHADHQLPLARDMLFALPNVPFDHFQLGFELALELRAPSQFALARADGRAGWVAARLRRIEAVVVR